MVNLVRSLPDNKGNLTFGWNNGNHSAAIINRHIGSYQNLNYDNSFQEANDTVRGLLTRKIDSYATFDFQYNYAHTWANDNLGTTRLTVGVLDAFNEDLTFYRESTLDYDSVVFDGRGRRWYARVLWQFQ